MAHMSCSADVFQAKPEWNNIHENLIQCAQDLVHGSSSNKTMTLSMQLRGRRDKVLKVLDP